MTDTNRRPLLATTATALTTTGLAGCTSDTDTPGTIATEIETKDAWDGLVRYRETTRDISGRGADRYEWTDDLHGLLHVSVSKGPKADIPLTITILADDERIKHATTTELYDRIQLSHSF